MLDCCLYIIKILEHTTYRFEIEDLLIVETQLCKLCVILRSRVLLGVSSFVIYM